jgi:hypothetical protein
MKKALVVFLVLAVAGGLIAQDAPTFTWGGELVTGAQVIINEDFDDPQFALAHDDGKTRVRLNGTVEGPTYGFKFRLQAANVLDDPSGRAVTMPFAFGYISFLDKLLKVTAGQIDGAVWSTPVIGSDWDSGAAVRFEITPSQLAGLNIGFTLRPPQFEAPKGVVGTPDGLVNAFQETSIGVKYALDIMEIKAALKLDGDGDTAKDMNAAFGLSYKGVPGLTADFDVVAANLSDYEEAGTGVIKIGEKIGYKLMEDKLDVSLAARELLYSLKDSKIGIRVEPAVTYQINDTLKAGLNVGVGSGDVFEHLGFNIKPSLTYTIGKASLAFQYTFNSHNGRPDLETVVADGKSLQTIGANFTWSF